MIDRIRDLLKAKDWHPFTIHRAGGNSIQVISREQAWVSPYSRLVVEIAPGWIEILSPDQTTGVDVASDYGAPVHATADGVVTTVENHAGYGRLVVIDHGFGITTWYAHLSSFSAIAGARVKRGTVVGYTGISGRSTGPHVHYEVRVNNAPVNPWRYMRSNPTGD